MAAARRASLLVVLFVAMHARVAEAARQPIKPEVFNMLVDGEAVISSASHGQSYMFRVDSRGADEQQLCGVHPWCCATRKHGDWPVHLQESWYVLGPSQGLPFAAAFVDEKGNSMGSRGLNSWGNRGGGSGPLVPGSGTADTTGGGYAWPDLPGQ